MILIDLYSLSKADATFLKGGGGRVQPNSVYTKVFGLHARGRGWPRSLDPPGSAPVYWVNTSTVDLVVMEANN